MKNDNNEVEEGTSEKLIRNKKKKEGKKNRKFHLFSKYFSVNFFEGRFWANSRLEEHGRTHMGNKSFRTRKTLV